MCERGYGCPCMPRAETNSSGPNSLGSTESINQYAREHPQHTANGESFTEDGFELCFGETHLKSTWMTKDRKKRAWLSHDQLAIALA